MAGISVKQERLTQALAHSLKRLLRRSQPWMKRYGAGIGLGGALALLGLIYFKDSDNPEIHPVFKQSGAFDFKNSSILGNPSKLLLKEEESKLAQTHRNVLELQNQLKEEVEALKKELTQLKSQAPGADSAHLTPSQDSQALQSAPPSISLPNDPKKAGSQLRGYGENERLLGSASHSNSNAQLVERGGGQSGILGFSELGPRSRSYRAGATMLSFPVKSTGKAYLKKPEIILPTGSYVKATLMTGVEAPEGKPYPVLLQLDFAFVIPNDKRLDLAGCFMIAKAQGDLSTERVQMQATKLSCVSKKGGMFERNINGFVSDDTDNSFAVIGRVNTKQDRVAATAFLAGIVSGIGKAIQQAQTTQQTTPLGGSQSVVTGDQMKFIGAGGASEAATLVTQWYLKQAQNLLPTINIGSGQRIWVVMQDPVHLPKDYFTQNHSTGVSNASIYSYFTRILD